ncbi:hypothetical protein J437_LFUL005425 [Ladona fulva]|uniref:Cancer-related nucleoside-triphosphatase n=1 Tax=Ladona fulva TaxID=123851 RepID=A0A8K0JWD1_LADFU|nr:hypothetical protein J437_LFUL005425 [Ladona fulva]
MSVTAANKPLQILLTGPPGVGKTTLVKKICSSLQAEEVSISGFYTEEVRNGGQRIGFDVVTMEGKRGTLARVGGTGGMPKVGQYSVDVKSFESLALPTLESQQAVITVIDEIGKMEMFSEPFKQMVVKVFKSCKPILATIPLPKGRPLPFIDNLKKGQNVRVVMVNRENRNSLADELSASLLATTK